MRVATLTGLESVGVHGHGPQLAPLLDVLYDGAYVVDQEDIITYWNPAAEQITGFSSSEVLGRVCSDGILAHVDVGGECLCGAQCPRRSALHTGQCTEAATFLRHKDGQRVPVSMRVLPLSSTQTGSAGSLAVFRADPTCGVAAEPQELRTLALLDPLTKLPNRQFCENALDTQLEEMRRYDSPFGVLVLDIDDLKKINDNHGREMGDRVLHMVAQTLSNNCRLSDIVGRWGGEEFVAILVNVEERQLSVAAEKFRALTESASLPTTMERVSVTLSVGGTMARVNDTSITLLDRADKRLSRSKAAGKNRATVAR